MKVVFLLCFLTATLATQEEWMNFKLQHGKSYEDPREENLRLQIYQRNKLKIDEHNRRYQLGLETYTLGMNKFGDLTEEEFAAEYLNEDLTRLIMTVGNSTTYTPRATSALPLSVDWRTKGAVTNVKNQGNCGACYAFSAVGALETQMFLRTGQLASLSAQQIVDCSLNYRYRNKGCKGGMPGNSYRYIKDLGIAAEQDYPYEGNVDWRIGCRYGRGMKSAGRCTGFVQLRPGDEAQLADAVANVGTISVVVQSRKSNFQFYKSGVHYSPRCDHKFVDHAMLLVGYGTTENGEDYWLVKNSWGPEWGEDGYVRMARNRGNNCGIASGSTYPLV